MAIRIKDEHYNIKDGSPKVGHAVQVVPRVAL